MTSKAETASVLVLTPVRQAAGHVDRYFELLDRIEHPPELLSVGLLEGDSTDGTFALLESRLEELRSRYRRVTLTRWSSGLEFPGGAPGWSVPFQTPGRPFLARVRTRLLMAALDDEVWFLWLDGDVADSPADVLTR